MSLSEKQCKVCGLVYVGERLCRCREFIKELKEEAERNNYPMEILNQIINKLAGDKLTK